MPRKPASSLAWLWANGSLTIVMFGTFIVCWVALVFAGWGTHNQELADHHATPLRLGQYLTSAHLWEATTENWEGEFLPMAVFTLLTAKLVQKGSPESKEPNEQLGPVEPKDNSPWPTRSNAVIQGLFNYSLTLALFACFFLSLGGHIWAGTRLASEDAQLHGHPAVRLGAYLASSEFWFQSFQNFQSEFLANGAMVILAIFLRQKGSPESKRVNTPTWETDD